ncbi:H-type lectin domain-containing protein [Nevskia ramosa]|uniref:H-type lectin domain-containing protein n=1 Tax=Nevskia ramosa TaxID=64002 RepID=UPI003D13C871
MATAKSKGIGQREYWLDIIIAVIALVSAVALAWLTARSTSKSETTATAYEEKYKNLERVYSKYVPSGEPFTADAQVTTALTEIDASNASSLRVRVFLTSISRQGFELRVQTLGDTKLHFVQVTWIAFQKGL